MIRDRITQFIYTLAKQVYFSRGGVLLGRGTGAGPAEEIIIGDGLDLTDGTLTAAGGSGAWSDITGKPTTLNGYGITDAQPIDSDLTAYANAADSAARRALIGAEVAGAAAAAQSASQPLDADLTALAALTTTTAGRALLTGADAAAIRGQVGAVGTPLEITTALQGAVANPVKIGAEYMPDALNPDYIRPGENSGGTASILPVGSLTRQGAILYYHDGTTPGGVQVGGVATGATDRASGVAILLPFGTTVSGVASTVKNIPAAGVYYVQEIGRVKVSGSKLVAGNRISFSGRIRAKSDALGTALNGNILFVPLARWVAQSSQGTATPSVPNVRVFNQTDAYEVTADFYYTTNPITVGVGGVISAGPNTSTTPFARGVNHTTGAVFSVTDTPGTLASTDALIAGQDAEFVVCFRTTVSETRSIWFDVAVNAYTP